MNVHTKFIIEDGFLILGYCTLHSQLCKDVEEVRGGGIFRLENGIFYLSGSSYDFGTAQLKDIQEAIDQDKIIINRKKYKKSNKYKFVYSEYDKITSLN